MYFEEAFKKIKTALDKAAPAVTDGHFAIQIRMTDNDCGGTFYIELADKHVYVEPYDYYDNDVDVAATYKNILSMAKGTLDIETAIADGIIYAGGNVDQFIAFAKSIKPKKSTPRKTTKANSAATKKCAVKKTAKSAKTKTEASKMDDKKETITEVVEKEVKPKKNGKKTTK